MMNRIAIGAAVMAAWGLTACNQSQSTAEGDAPATAPATTDAAALESATAATTVDPAFIVGLNAVRDVRVGMTLAEVGALGHRSEVTQPADEGGTCSYAEIAGLEGIGVMLDGPRIVRFDVSLPAEGADAAPAMRWRTAEGAGLGTSEAELRQIYGARMLVETNKYDERWHDLIVRAEGSNRALLFQTDGVTVQAWRTGDWDAVQLVEGCS